ncbi:hypothetical protein [Comamonas sp. NoAH]|uniref:DUF6630 family protein n=1 Tax=Comamonas halotolerans TaxID=3041496 RepID=UPI0024E05DD3|nr:hypothetical protein [Comamonas sp. NoAH]
MPRYALLLAHDERPSPTTVWPSQAGSNCDGWAEWFSATPLLFSVLLGDAHQLPELTPCSAYQDKENLSALAAPMDAVKTRWQWLKAQMEPLPAHWPNSLHKLWQEIDATITQSTRQWLLLDCATLCPHDFDEPEFLLFLQALRDQCLAWDCSSNDFPEVLQKLKQDPVSQLGWWSPSVIARTEVVEPDSEENWPAWLANHYEPRYHNAWEEALDAYMVMPKLHPRTGRPPQNKSERDDWPMGLVTPYGRWLLRPIEGASMAFASGDAISVRYPETTPGEGCKSGLKDLNGVWTVPPSAGYRDAYAITPHVMACKSTADPAREDLRSLPGLQLLHEAVSHVEYDEEGDGVLRAAAGDDLAPQALMLNTHGQPLFDSSRYERVNPFNAKTGLAVALIRRPYTDAHGEENSHIYEGVLHISGKEIVPCEFELIERGFNNSPPKVFPGGKLLAFTHEGNPRVYNTQGKLLAAPDIWCAPLHRNVKKNELLAFMGERPDAEMGMFSLKDFSFSPSGETWQDYSDALQGAFKRLIEPSETTTVTRTALIEGEDAQWMQAITRILSLGDETEAAQLLEQWRECVANPDPDDLGWDSDEDEFAPEHMELPADENLLTLYWVHLQAIATHFAHIDWKNSDALRDSTWLPGAQDWCWDRADEGDGISDGFASLAAHLEPQGLSLLHLATDDDSRRFGVVRTEDAQELLELLDQAVCRAWLEQAVH